MVAKHAGTMRWNRRTQASLETTMLGTLAEVLLTIADDIVGIATEHSAPDPESRLIIEMDCQQLAAQIVRELRRGSLIRVRGD